MITHQDSWNFYFTEINDNPCSIALNMGLEQVAPMPNYIHRLIVSVQMNNPDTTGLSSNGEIETLYQIEDALIEALKHRHQFIQVGRITVDGRREFVFYGSDATLYDKSISDVMVNFPNYEYGYALEEDKQWEFYLEFLYPGEYELQSIFNRGVVQNLLDAGDDLSKEREVDHFIYFETEKDREFFLAEIVDDGFSIVKTDHYPDREKLPYLLHLSRIDKVDMNSVDEYTLSLYDIAKQCKGQYDGWGCPIVAE